MLCRYTVPFTLKRKATLELWHLSHHKFLVLPENSTGQLQGAAPNTDEKLLSCDNSASNFPGKKKKDFFSLFGNKTERLGKWKDTERYVHQGVDAISWKQNTPSQWHCIIRSCWFRSPRPRSAMSGMSNVLSVRSHPANCYKQLHAIKWDFLFPLSFFLEHDSILLRALEEPQAFSGF